MIRSLSQYATIFHMHKAFFRVSRAFHATTHKRVKLYESVSNDPFFNLAAEEWMFRHTDPDWHVFFWWRNAPSVIIGRFQNPWTECQTERLERDNVNLVRRKSGGGAVYQDLGNSIFTFITPRDEFSKTRNNSTLLEALDTFGVRALAKGRNDLVDADGGRKFSGSAFELTGARALHHGTLMVDVDMSALSRYLTPAPAKLRSKGVSSVQARVANLAQLVADETVADEALPCLDHDSLGHALMSTFCAQHGVAFNPSEVTRLQPSDLDNPPAEMVQLRSYYDELKSWKWRIARTPEFSHRASTRFDWGMVDLHLDVSNGLIGDVKLYSDCLYVQLVEVLQSALKGVTYSSDGLRTALGRAVDALRKSTQKDARLDGASTGTSSSNTVRQIEQHATDFFAWMSQFHKSDVG